jgi:hypothetical protein
MSLEVLTREVLEVLYDNNAYWDCGGPSDRPGLTFDELLASLQERFPASGWDTELLRLITRVGFRQGTMKIFTTNSATCPQLLIPPTPPAPARYFANNFMIRERFPNIQYLDVSPRICNPCPRKKIGNVI